MTGDRIAKKIGFEPKIQGLSKWPDENIKFLPDDEGEIKEIAKFLINKYRTDLQNVNIAYVFKQKASKSGDSVILGQAKIESDLQKALHSYDAVVIIGFDVWVELDLDQKLRLVLHELEHLIRDLESGKIKTQSHTVEEFPLVMQIFGPANDDQINFIQAWERFKNDNPGSATI
jgi:ribosome-binding ATPase YchF (GTP1/OBG family)